MADPESHGGWRFAMGLTIFAAGFCSPAAIPLVAASDLSGGWKTVLSGTLAFGLPEVLMLAATAVMGKAGFAELKRRLGGFLRRYGPPDTVGPVRYRIGLVMFAAPILLGWLGPYLRHHLPGFESRPLAWHLGGDAVFLASLFVLGGDFWDKLRALFVQQARAVFPQAAESPAPAESRSRRASHHLAAFLLCAASLGVCAGPAAAADLEADAWPEFDIWIALDETGRDRIYILNSYASEPKYQYEETALGVSWDRRLNPSWSFRIGARYIWKQVDPPDKNETRVVLDLKWFKPLGRGFLLTDRNRLDLRLFQGSDNSSFRYRNRLQIEKPFPVGAKGWTWTGFTSFEIYYDSRFDEWGQRRRFIAGVSVPIVKWASVDVFYGYHLETKPARESGSALGVAFGIYFWRRERAGCGM